MSSVDLRDLTSGAVAEQLTELGHLSHADLDADSVILDLDLDGPPEPAVGALIAQAVLGVRHDLKLVVRLPEKQDLIGSLVRSGVVSALASRGGAVSYESASLLATYDYDNLWDTWTPGARQAMAPLFRHREPMSGLFGPTHAVFVNPHLTTEPGEQASVTRLVRRWLAQSVVPDLADAERLKAVDLPAFAIDQLLRNISEHAVTPRRPAIDSMVQVEVLDPGPAATRFLQVTVLDTGAGVAATLWPKINPVEFADDVTLLGALLDGRVPGWGRGRGVGLASLARHVIAQSGACLELWSGAVRVRALEHVEARFLDDVDISGTVVTVRFPLPAL